ncbi:MAG TPA: S1/P1 nuclease [Gammaproteobacteria bacterium]|nr:S1/P1 nuclease [Gammaproteobacteria bacterium]
MIKIFRTLFLIVLLIVPHVAYSWGLEGHRVIAKIATDHLTDQTKNGVQSLLGFKNLAMISNLADESYRGRYPHTAKWHYCNDDKDTSLTWKKGDKVKNISHAIQYETSVLKDPNSSKEDKKVALIWLVHLVGDAHQPFHAGHEHDRGGNLCYVRWYNKIASLHQIWDTKLIESLKLSYSEYADWIEERLDTRDIDAYNDSDVSHWLHESKLILESLYPKKKNGCDYCTFSKKTKLSNKQKKNLPFVTISYRTKVQDSLDNQLHLAGRRLAVVLNGIDF